MVNKVAGSLVKSLWGKPKINLVTNKLAVQIGSLFCHILLIKPAHLSKILDDVGDEA